MEQVRFDRWLLEVDRASTEEAYRQVVPGPEKCGCVTCRNFVAVGQLVYPPAFHALCSRLGIHMEKACEVYECGRSQDGKYVYGGWFHFVGRVESAPENQDYRYTDGESGFTFYFTDRLALVPEALRERPLVQVEFTLTAPWVLDEPAPG